MPVIKSAKKKLRQDKKRTLVRAKVEQTMKDAVKKAVAQPSAKALSVASSLIDKAAKEHILHKNKAARIKSKLAHLLSPKGEVKPAVKTAPKAKKPAVKKAAAKKTAKKSK